MDAQNGIADATAAECSTELGTWIEQDLGQGAVLDDAGTAVNLFDIWGVDESAIWAVGSEGTVLLFDGATWQRQPTPTQAQLTSVWGTSVNNVWAAGFGGVVLHYDGSQWVDNSPPSDVFMTTDAGVPTGDAAADVRRNLWGIWVAGRDDITVSVYVVGDRGTMLVYQDDAWARVDSDVEEDLSAVWGANENAVFAVGDFGAAVIGSAAGGFSKQQTGVDKHLRGVWGHSAGEVYAVGVGGVVLRYGGSDWTLLEGAPQQVLRDIWGPDNDRATNQIVGWDGALLQMTRGGGGATFGIAGCVAPNRLEGIWGTLVQGPVPDGGADPDGGVQDGDVDGPLVPEIWVVGVSGTVLKGP